jgi:hypothetical protein
MSVEVGVPLGAAGLPAGGAPVGGLRGLARWWRDSVAEPVISVLFPPRCVGCGDFESHLCARCEASLVPIGHECCPRCGEPGPRPLVARRCSHCMGVDLTYAGARSAFLHAGVAKRMVVEFKSGGQPVLAALMARLAEPAFRELVAAAAATAGERVAVTWVPSHPGLSKGARLQPGGASRSRPGRQPPEAAHSRVDPQAGADQTSEGAGAGGPAEQPAASVRPR